MAVRRSSVATLAEILAKGADANSKTITSIAGLTGIAGGMSISAVSSLAGVAGGAAVTNIASVAGIAAGAAYTSVASVAGIAAGAGLSSIATIAGIAGGVAVSSVASVAGVAGGMALSNISSVALVSGATITGPTVTGNAGTATAFNLSTTVSQGGTAGYTLVKIYATESATGSGTKNLLDLGVGALSKFSVSNAGVLVAATLNLTSTLNSQYIGVNDGDSGNRYMSLRGSADDGSMIALEMNNGRDNGNLLITTFANRGSDHDHDTLSANPTISHHDATDPNISNNKYGYLAHDGNGYTIGTGPTTGAGSAPATIDNYLSFRPRGTERLRATGLGSILLTALAADPGAGEMAFNSAITFYLDEVAPALMVRVKTSAGAALTGTVCALA